MSNKQTRLKKEYLYQQSNKSDKKDNEYIYEQYQQPKILITTSRNPSDNLKRFHKEIIGLFPNSVNINWGNYQIKDVYEIGNNQNFSDIIFIHEQKGIPSGLVISHLPLGPTLFISLQNLIMRHDIAKNQDNISLAYPHLIFDNFNEQLGERIKQIFKNLFPIPQNNKSWRIISFFSREDFISLRHHQFEKNIRNKINLYEIGPRFEMRPFMIKLGTLQNKNATIEWSFKQHINTAGKNLKISKD